MTGTLCRTLHTQPVSSKDEINAHTDEVKQVVTVVTVVTAS